MNSSMVQAPEPEIIMEPPGPERTDYVRRGRPKKASHEARMHEVLHLYFVERLSMRKIAEVMGVSHMSVYRMLSDPNVEVLL
ncbi:helix-turn-helix domain-containing protein [Candidatus Micrarchaeota archaeon]|nr:helix-turn-helix domain-containing protein [Candidatus Micrarchaeota archaeon]